MKRYFITNSINEKWAENIPYIKTQKDGWCHLASGLDLHAKKIVEYFFGKNMTNDLVIGVASGKCEFTTLSQYLYFSINMVTLSIHL
ncbi:hypothetical protein [Clostridium perfringens]|uniref:Mobile element protein n=1 Tax=Clostridium perfringens TaxID=1502 RepID=A0A0N7BKY2_CLOPF|nr:hypothetical protein [Clostridium perfringens]AKF16688.1 Mobile element protein [Clostridium perfringens]